MEIRRIGDIWKEKYGEKVYKISLTAGCTCPNRDGTKGYGGCTFCSEKGSGDFAADSVLPIDSQIESAKKLVQNKGAKKYIAYFQSFTNTYGDVNRLKEMFSARARRPDIVEISIATRCDCLSDGVMEMLSDINRIKPLTVELGMQSASDETLSKCNCRYTIRDFDRAVARLKSRGIRTVAHIIVGFPWESEDDMVASAKHAGDLGVDGVKLQLLHVLKGTKLGADFEKEPFETLTLRRYTEILGKCLNALPKETEIHRLTGDGPKKDLLAPMWSADKRKTMNYINNYIKNLPDERIR